MSRTDEMFDIKVEKYLLKKKGYEDIPVGLLQYGVDYKKALGKDKAKAATLLKLIDREIASFKLNKSRAYKALGI